jgi:hypothetical protein
MMMTIYPVAWCGVCCAREVVQPVQQKARCMHHEADVERNAMSSRIPLASVPCQQSIVQRTDHELTSLTLRQSGAKNKRCGNLARKTDYKKTGLVHIAQHAGAFQLPLLT